jgi:hypothetical protein
MTVSVLPSSSAATESPDSHHLFVLLRDLPGKPVVNSYIPAIQAVKSSAVWSGVWLHPVAQTATARDIHSKFSVTGMGLCPRSAITDPETASDPATNKESGLLCLFLKTDAGSDAPEFSDVRLLQSLCSAGGGVCTTVSHLLLLKFALYVTKPALVHITHCDLPGEGLTSYVDSVFAALMGKGCRYPRGFVVGIVVNVMLPEAAEQSRRLLEACGAMFVLTWKRVGSEVPEHADRIRHRMVRGRSNPLWRRDVS